MIKSKSILSRIFLSPPHMAGEEIRFIKEAFDSNYVAPLGPMVDAYAARQRAAAHGAWRKA